MKNDNLKLKSTLLILLSLFIFLPAVTKAQVDGGGKEEVLKIELPEPGIAADSIFYFFDTLAEKINLFFTFDKEKKTRLTLDYANEKLAETQEAINQKKSANTIKKSAKQYQDYLIIAKESLTELGERAQTPEGLEGIFEEAFDSGKDIFEKTSDNTPPEVKNVLNSIWVLTKQKLGEGVNALKEKAKEKASQKAEELKEEIKKDIRSESKKQGEKLKEKTNIGAGGILDKIKSFFRENQNGEAPPTF